MEKIAKSKFEEHTGIKVRDCGLFIDQEYPYLAASPGLCFIIFIINNLFYK